MPTSRPIRALVLVAVLAGVAGLLLALPWGDALERGRARHHYRVALGSQLQRRHAERPLIVWMGDSTLWKQGDVVPYPRLVDRALGPRAETLILRLPGLDAFHYYYLMGRVLEAGPDLVVVTANLRMFDPRGAATLNDLASFVPIGELGRALSLPLEARGLSAVPLLGAQLLRLEPALQAYYAIDGMRALRAGEAVDLAPPGPELAQYGRALDEDAPVVRMLGACVAMASRRGARVIVVVAPIPVARLEAAWLYDPAVFRTKAALLRRVVETEGGTLVDLHDALAARDFSDDSGHLDRAGNDRVAALLLPRVERELGLRAEAGAR